MHHTMANTDWTLNVGRADVSLIFINFWRIQIPASSVSEPGVEIY